jgi:arsenical pump membrane protein
LVIDAPLRRYGEPVMTFSRAVDLRARLEGESGVGLVLAGCGVVGLVVAAVARPTEARAAAAQVWPPFVLVAGLLLIGLVADDDGLFAAAGRQLARTARTGVVIYVGATALVGVVTALLNLDTAVAFLTPVLVYAARSRGEGEGVLLYGCLLLANAGSLFLPGSNLTNLIVLGHLHLTGGQFFARMWAPGSAALLVTATVVGVFGRKSLLVRSDDPDEVERPVLGLGLLAIAAAALLVLVLRAPALPVLAIGLGAVGVRIASKKEQVGHAIGVLGLPVLLGLFGVAVAVGTLGRIWTGPATLLLHLDTWGTAVVAALTSVLINNLPAASLLAAHRPPHPYALLIGLNVGPNLFVTGSLAWLLWLRAARAAGARPSLLAASRIGVVAVPLALAAAVGLLVLLGTH